MKVLLAYDGSPDSKAALKYGIRKVQKYNGELILLNVFQRDLFIDHEAGQKGETIARLEALRHVAEARMLLLENGRGFRARWVLAEGNVQDEVLKCSKTENVDLIVAGRGLESIVGNAYCLTDIVSAADEAVPELAGIIDGHEGIANTGTGRPF